MAGKKITELTQANTVTDNDLFIVETANGTCSIPYSEIKKMFQNMLETETNTGDTKSFPFVDCAASHNGIFRGKDLTNVYTIDEICERISNGTFEDLYIGDYFDVTISTEYTANEVVRCVLAGFDTVPFYGDLNLGNNVYININKHHASIVTKNAFTKTHSLYTESDSINRGFDGSNLRSVLDTYGRALDTKLNNHIVPHMRIVSKYIDSAGVLKTVSDSGASSRYIISLLSEHQIFGTSFYSNPEEHDACSKLLPLFDLNPSSINCKYGGINDIIKNSSGGFDSKSYWLINYADGKSEFCCLKSYTSHVIFDIPYTKSGIRPYFLIG